MITKQDNAIYFLCVVFGLEEFISRLQDLCFVLIKSVKLLDVMEKYIESLGFNNAFYNGKIASYSILFFGITCLF